MKYFLLLFLSIQLSVFAQQNKESDTLQQIFQSLSAAQTSKDDLKVIQEANHLGDFYFSRDDATNALQYYDTAFITAKKLNHHMLMGESLNNKGEVLLYKADYKNAINTYSRAAEMYTKAGNDAQLAATLNNLGKVTALTGNYKKAYKIFEQANSKARRTNNQQAIVDSYAGIASALEKMGSHKYAEHYNKLYESEKMKLGEANQPVAVVAQNDKPKQNASSSVPVTGQGKTPKLKTVMSAVTNESITPNAIFLLGAILIFALLLTVFWFRKRLNAVRAQIESDLAKRDAVQQDSFRTLLGIREDLHADLSLIQSLHKGRSRANNLEVVSDKRESFEFATQKMDKNIDDMIWALDTHNITIATLLKDIEQHTANYFAVQPVRVVVDFPENPPQIKITKESYRALFVAVKETFHNITNHSGATEVIVKAGIADDYISVSIMDNGEIFDFEASKADKIALMEARFEKIGGKFSLFTKPLHGSHTTVGLPLYKVANL